MAGPRPRRCSKGWRSRRSARSRFRERVLTEMDIDALLARHPQLVLVDELAHANVAGSRHPRRYQDVEELLAAGIDVYTTVNIHHLESLNDAVAQITGVRVRETIPDSILERADEIELIDLSPDELLQRLREGKVYVADQTERAAHSYFRRGNMTALRELALRHTAERVDVQMKTYMQAHAIPGPWPAGDLMMVCVGPSPVAAQLVRSARRMADRRHARWIAVYVETPRHYRLSACRQSTLAQTLRLAAQLGAEVVTIPGQNVAEDLVRYARSCNVTEIVIGKPRRSRWEELWHGSLVSDVIHDSGKIDVYVIPAEQEPPARQTRPGDDGGRRSAARRLRFEPAPGGADRHRRQGAAVVPLAAQRGHRLLGPGADQRGHVGPGTLHRGRVLQRAGLRLPLRAAVLHVHHRQPAGCAGAIHLPGRRRDHQQPHGAHQDAGRGRGQAREPHGRALCSQPAGGARPRPGGSAPGHRQPGGDAAQRAGLGPAAGEGRAGAAGILPARQDAGRVRAGRSHLGLATQPPGRPRLRHPAGRRVDLRAAGHRPRHRGRAGAASGGAGCRAPARPGAGCWRRWPTRPPWPSSGPTWPATWPRPGCWPRPSGCAAPCFLPSRTTCARRSPPSSGAVTSLLNYGAGYDDATRRDLLIHHPGGGRTAQPLRGQPARHDPPGIGRAAAQP